MKKFIKKTLPACVALVAACLHGEAVANAHWRVTSNFNDQSVFQSTIDTLDRNNRAIDGLAINPSGDWIMISGTDVWASSGFNTTVRNAVRSHVANGHRVVAADCNELGACIVVYDNWGFHRVGTIPQNLRDTITNYQNNRWAIRDVEFTANGFVVLGSGSLATYANVDSDLQAALFDRRASGRTVDNVEIGFNNEWAILAGHNAMYENVHATIASRLDTISRSNHRIDEFLIGAGSNYVAYSGGSYARTTGTAIDQIEFSLGAANITNIWQRMQELGVSGISIAIIEPGGNNPRVSLARGYGRKKSDEQLPVLATTPFKLASLSKYLGGITVLDQIESDSTAAFNTDITQVCSNCNLDTWQSLGEGSSASLYGIPANDLGRGITLERLMSHTAGINNFSTRIVQSSWSVAAGQETWEWLAGMTCSGGTCDPTGQAPTWRTMTAGAQYSYSNGGFLIAQAYLEDKDDDTIDNILQTRLFDQVGMPNSSGRMNLTSSFRNSAAWQHGSGGPQAELAQSVARLAGGVWSSSADYGEAMIVALNQGRNSQGRQVLNGGSVQEMLTIQPNSTYGWGVNMDASVTESNDEDFFHDGENSSRVYTYMCGNPTRDEGFVILTNTESPGSRTLVSEVRAAYLRSVGWPDSRTCN